MRIFRKPLQALALVGGVVAFFFGLAAPFPLSISLAIGGAIFSGCSLIAISVDRD